MKRICFLIGNLNHAGGTERVTSMIANSLVKQGYDVSIISLSGGNHPFFPLENNVKVFGLFDTKVSFKVNFFQTVAKIRKIIRENSCSNVVVVDSIACIFTIPALVGLKVNHICWEHFNFNNNNGSRLRDLSRKLAVYFCDYIVTLTDRDKFYWIKNLKLFKAKILSIPNPVILQLDGNIASLNSRTVISVGRLVEVKGFDRLLKAWSKVIKSHPDWMLKIVGGGEQEQFLKDLSITLDIANNVSFVGATNNVEEYYLQASFYCLSSRFEGFPMVLLEAQSYGLPIVSFDCDTGPSEIIEDGFNGYLAKAGNVDELIFKLNLMIESSDIHFKNMSINSLENIKKFSIENVTAQWTKILK